MTATLFDSLTVDPWRTDPQHARTVVEWRSRFREPVFAESALREVENAILSFGEVETDAISTWVVEHPQRESLEDVRNRMRASLMTQLVQWNRLLDGGIAHRPRRRMPTLKKIAAHHNLPEPPACVRCGWEPPTETWAQANGWLERAHIIDRVFGGLDLSANLAPLCSACHKVQPIFQPGDEEIALAWFGLDGGSTAA